MGRFVCYMYGVSGVIFSDSFTAYRPVNYMCGIASTDYIVISLVLIGIY